MAFLMDLVAGDEPDILLAISVDDRAGSTTGPGSTPISRSAAASTRRGSTSSREAIRAVTGARSRGDFIDARRELDGPPTRQAGDRAGRPRLDRRDRAHRRRPDRRGRRSLGRPRRGGARLPAARGEALDPAARRRHRRRSPGPPIGPRTCSSPGRSEDDDDLRRASQGLGHAGAHCDGDREVAKAIRAADPADARPTGPSTSAPGPACSGSPSSMTSASSSSPIRRPACSRSRPRSSQRRGLANVRVVRPRSPRRSHAAPTGLRPRGLAARSSTTSRTRPRSLAAIHERSLVPGGRIALADLDTEDGTFHDAERRGDPPPRVPSRRRSTAAGRRRRLRGRRDADRRR